jgi:Lysyl oxidase/Bacterial Ig domain
MRSFRCSSGQRWIAALALAAVTLAIVTAAATPQALAAADLLPDLVAPPPANPQLAVERLGDGQDHFLLRFSGYIHNVGAGPLEIRGSNPVNGLMTVTGQRIYRRDSSFYDDNSRHPQIQFETADGHNHWHLRNAARFSLWNETGTVPVAQGAKVGFCLEDVDRIDSFAASKAAYSSSATEYCREAQPSASRVFEGISSGWQDVYAAKLPFQWVDTSDVAPGRYRLGAQVDPDNFVLERNEANNGPTLASDIVTVPGWLASSGTVRVTRTETIVLGAQPYGSPGPATFRIESGPRHGKLNVTARAPVPAFQVVYTPDRGFAGSDSFTFSARDSSSPFPIHAAVGTVSVTVPRTGIRSLRRVHLLAKLRLQRHGRFLTLRARARRTGMLRVQIKKGPRLLGSCAKRARTRRRFRCRVELRSHASVRGAKVIVNLIVHGRPAAVDVFHVPRRVR